MVKVVVDDKVYEFKSGRIADLIKTVIQVRHEVASGHKTLHLECNGKKIKPRVTTELESVETTE